MGKIPRIAIHNPNTSSMWCPSDEEYIYDKNWASPKTRDQLILNRWTKDSIVYEYDELGFRNPLGSTPAGAILALGCGYTYGIGLPIEVMWPSILAKRLGLKVYNAGQPGGSSDTSFRIARELIPKYKPAIVFHLVEFKNRFEVVSDVINDGDPIIGLSAISDHFDKSIQDLLPIFTNKFRDELSQHKNILAITQLCSNTGIQYIAIINTNPIIINNDCARDLRHPGPEWQAKIVDQMITQRYGKNQISNQLS